MLQGWSPNHEMSAWLRSIFACRGYMGISPDIPTKYGRDAGKMGRRDEWVVCNGATEFTLP